MNQNLQDTYNQLIPFVLKASIPASGWQGDPYGWDYVSATSFRVGGDAATADVSRFYPVGLKLAWDDVGSGTPKYAYVGSAVYGTTTTIYTVPTSDYTFNGSAIYNPATSRISQPAGFPQWFNYAPVLGGFSTAPSGTVCRFKIDAGECTVLHREATAGTSNETLFSVGAPLRSAAIANAFWGVAMFGVTNGGTVLTTACKAQIGGTATSIILYADMGITSSNWAATGDKRANFLLRYEI